MSGSDEGGNLSTPDSRSDLAVTRLSLQIEALQASLDASTSAIEHFTNTLESIADGLVTLDSLGRVTYANQAAERVLQRPRASFVGRPLWRRFRAARHSTFRRELQRAFTEHTAVAFEALYAPVDAWLDVRAYPLADGFAVHFRDVSEAHQAREALRVSEERFRLLASATNDAVWDLDLTTDRLTWGEGFETLFGWDRAEVEPTLDSWSNRLHPDDRTATLDDFYEVVQYGGSSWSGEYRFLRKNGDYAYVLDRGSIIRDDFGMPVRIIGGITDLTERRLAEERLAEQADLLDKAQDAIIVRDLDHRITFWNQGAERIYGWKVAEAMGQSARQLLSRDPVHFDDSMRQLQAAGDWMGELAQVDRAGRLLTIEGRWTLVQRDGGLAQVLAIHTDVTERKRLEQQFLRAQRMESLGTLAGGIAHDLNNVLAPIMMSIDLLRMDETDPANLSVLATIEASARRGADMVRQVLFFARGVGGRRVEVRIPHLLRDIEKISNETFLKSIEVTVSCPADLYTVAGDPTQLHQVLLNLAVNARDAMPSGGRLRLSARNLVLDGRDQFPGAVAPQGPYVLIEVEDTGSGIPAAIFDKIFDPFFTTKELGKGTGLGLSTSMAIVKGHGGFIRPYTEPGRGSTFSVYLPAHPSPGLVPETTAEADLPRGHGELVLVVDDEASVRDITTRTLEAFGYRVVTAQDGAEASAIYALQHRHIAVVLTDMMMPGLDGPATIERLRTINPDARIIAASGLSANQRRLTGMVPGVKAFLAKPYTADTLLTALRDALR